MSKFTELLDKMEKETVKRCSHTFVSGTNEKPTAYCAVAWMAKELNGGKMPTNDRVNETVRNKLQFPKGILTLIYQINDEHPKWTWEKMADELRCEVLPRLEPTRRMTALMEVKHEQNRRETNLSKLRIHQWCANTRATGSSDLQR